MPRAGLVELNAVAAVAAHKSFRGASAELGMSPSALSHAIATLEKRMGVRLFHRTTRSVALSEAGEQFLARVRPALREISEAMEAVNEFRDSPRGTLRINAPEGAARLVLLPKVLGLVARHPEIHVEVATNDRFVDIVAEGFDAGVRFRDSVPEDMVAVPCTPDVRFAVVGAPRYFKTHPVPKVPADLLAHACIRRRWPGGAIFRWQLGKRGEETAIDVRGPLTLDRDPLMIDAALEGVGLAYVSEWEVVAELASKKLVRVLEDWTPKYPGFCLYYPGHRHVPAALRAFAQLLQEDTMLKKAAVVAPSRGSASARRASDRA
jgi:DNA-binding transcriptional LysR family regulator